MRRRDLCVGGMLALAAGRHARAQATRKARIGWLTTGEAVPRSYFEAAMARLGWTLGQNLTIEARVSGPEPTRRAEAATALIAAQLDLIVVGGSTDIPALWALNRTVPIVAIHGTDLVDAGFAKSLAHPGGNVTGNTVLGRELDGKRLELLRELLPTARQASMLGLTLLANYRQRMDEVELMARPMGVALKRRMIESPVQFEAAIAAAASEGDGAILVPFNALTFENMPSLVALTARFRLPAIYEFREYVALGGLISYGAVYRDYFERTALLADKILRGASPAELPIEQPTRFELTVNLKTARALGLTVAPSILARADEVID